MQSFRSEFEEGIVQKDIVHLRDSIAAFHGEKFDGEKFRSYRLARGVYGQRQEGVQMIRIKLPYGKMSVKQMLRICDVSDEYASKKLHFTTRQDVQIHYVSLDRTPELWEELEKDQITLREACGNTVRNVTASVKAGVDPDELFDVSPYAHAIFEYFLRNPICQDMGRKIKVAFSATEKDTGVTYMHDLGFIPKIKDRERGFKIVVGGGLGGQPFVAQTAHDFLHEDAIIPFMEACLRVFDRHGERNNRNKARMKFLINKIGLEAFMALVEVETTANKVKSFKINRDKIGEPTIPTIGDLAAVTIADKDAYKKWLDTNVFEQKQKGHFGVFVKVLNGDMSTEQARKFADVVTKYATADDMRISINQGLLLKYVPENVLENLYSELLAINLADPGFDSTADITSCPGTDTCNLGISNSTGITKVLEGVINKEFPDLIYNNDIKIKISGCMNACGQHTIANIGFHGSSLRAEKGTIPALQVLLGGGIISDGNGRMADKVTKVPSKRGPDVLRLVLNDYDTNANDGEYFNDYYVRQGKDYFYQILKPLKDLDNLTNDDYSDWGQEEKYKVEIGIGECAGVVIDLVATLVLEAQEKLAHAKESLTEERYADSIYQTYSFFVNTAKALLLDKKVRCNTQSSIIEDFDKHYVETKEFDFSTSFKSFVLRINESEPSKEFADTYYADAVTFAKQTKQFTDARLANAV